MKRIRFLALFALLGALLVPTATASAARVTTVNQGHSIQAAINAAPAGGTIVVNRGTYRENLLIRKSIRIIGHSAVLRPPTSPAANVCAGGESSTDDVTGICIAGTLDSQGSVTATVNRVSISGLTVLGFGGSGAFAVGASHLTVINSNFGGNGGYGLFVNSSSNSVIVNNHSYSNGDAGFYIGDSPTAGGTLVSNGSYNNRGEGILWRDALGGRATLNSIHGNCAGIIVVDTGAPGAAGNVSIALNDITANNRFCPGEPGEAPPFGGMGVGLVGAQNATVIANLIRDNVVQTGAQLPGGGVVLLDSTMLGGAAPMNNNVHHNLITGNTPNDLFSDGTGTGNSLTANSCTTSTPSGLC